MSKIKYAIIPIRAAKAVLNVLPETCYVSEDWIPVSGEVLGYATHGAPIYQREQVLIIECAPHKLSHSEMEALQVELERHSDRVGLAPSKIREVLAAKAATDNYKLKPQK